MRYEYLRAVFTPQHVYSVELDRHGPIFEELELEAGLELALDDLVSCVHLLLQGGEELQCVATPISGDRQGSRGRSG